MTKRKHRFYIDVEFSTPLDPTDAENLLRLVLARCDLFAGPIVTHGDTAIFIDGMTIVERRARQ